MKGLNVYFVSGKDDDDDPWDTFVIAADPIDAAKHWLKANSGMLDFIGNPDDIPFTVYFVGATDVLGWDTVKPGIIMWENIPREVMKIADIVKLIAQEGDDDAFQVTD